MKHKFQVIGDIDPVSIHGGHQFHQVVEKTVNRRPVKGISHGDVPVPVLDEGEGLMKKGKEGIR